MALTPQNSDAFLREVDDNLRRDQLLSLWRRRGWLLLTVVGGLLLLLAIGLWWRGHRRALAERDGEQMAAVLADAEANRAQAKDPRLVALAASSRQGYAALAKLTQADILATSDVARAAASYRAIAEDSTVAQPLRDLALLRATTLQLDSVPPQQVVDRMKPLAQPGGPWFGSAAELTGAAYLKMGRRDLAGPLFAAIARDPAVPASLRGRAANMATALGQTVGALPATGALKG